MNRKQFFIAVFSALIGATRWRKLFPRKLCFARRAFMPSNMGSLFNPTADIHSKWLASTQKPLVFHPNCFSMVYPKIGDTLTIREPASFSLVNPEANVTILG